MAILALILCYLIWGLFPIFWKQLAHISSIEILFQRIIWSFLFYALITFAISLFSKTQRKTLLGGLENGKTWLKLFFSSAMITGNWFLYIYAVNTGQILQGSLAYYMSPLLSVVAGSLFFKEILSARARWALGFCGLGVFLLAFGNTLFFDQAPVFPWLAIALALSFTGYSLIKKTVTIPALTSSFIEVLYFFIPALYFIFLSGHSTVARYTTHDWIYFIIGGAVTGLPLVFFSYATQRLPLTTVGFFQYVSPTLQLLTAIFIYSEDFSPMKLAAFCFIWIGLGIYISNLLKLKKGPGNSQ